MIRSLRIDPVTTAITNYAAALNAQLSTLDLPRVSVRPRNIVSVQLYSAVEMFVNLAIPLPASQQGPDYLFQGYLPPGVALLVSAPAPQNIVSAPPTIAQCYAATTSGTGALYLALIAGESEQL